MFRTSLHQGLAHYASTIAAALLGAAPIAVFADTFTVTNLDDSAASTGSLRWAVAQANATPNHSSNPADTIEFDPSVFSSAQTITLTSTELYFTGTTELRGPGEGLLTISANNAFRVIAIASGAVVSIHDLTIADGRSGFSGPSTPSTGNLGAGIMNLGELTLDGVTVSQCVNHLSSALGGGIYNSGTLTVVGSTITGNRSIGKANVGTGTIVTRGGGIYNEVGSEATFLNSALVGNHAEVNLEFASSVSYPNDARGGGIFNLGTARFDGCEIGGNVAKAESVLLGGSSLAYGGGIYNTGSVELVNGCRVHTNRTHASLLAEASRIGPAAEAAGGGLYNSQGTAAVTDSEFLDNVAESLDTGGYSGGGWAQGAGIFSTKGTTSIRRTSLCGNSCTASPGGTGATTHSVGGGAVFADRGTLTIHQCSVAENSAVSDPSFHLAGGGGVLVQFATFDIANSTIVSNSASVEGDRTACRGGGVLIIESNGGFSNNSVVSNSALLIDPGAQSFAAGGGFYADGSSSVDFANNAICGNTVASGFSSPDLGGTFTSLGHNICGDASGVSGLHSSDISGVTAISVFEDQDTSGGIDAADLIESGGSKILEINPLGAAADAGSNALLPDDPATGQPIATEQRGPGFPRIANGTTDIGAAERQLPPVSIPGKITYVDATPANTTLADGTPYAPQPSTQSGTDHLWKTRPFANGGTVYESNVDPEDAPRLRTRACGLVPGANYELFAYFWGGPNASWRGRANLADAPGDLPGYSTNLAPAEQLSPMTAVTTFVSGDQGLNPGPASTAGSDGFENGGYFANPVLSVEDGRVLYEVSLGTAAADQSGCVDVFIDDVASNSSLLRTWFDGIGHRPEPADPFGEWATSSGLTPGVNDGLHDDPNGDGKSNLVHFSDDTSPLGSGGSDEGKTRLSADSVDGDTYLTLTIPVRRGAIFSQIGPRMVSQPVEGLVYTIEGDDNLVIPFDLGAVEAGTVLDAGLPALRDVDGDGTPDWEYRTFHLGVPLSSMPRGFMRSVVSAPGE